MNGQEKRATVQKNFYYGHYYQAIAQNISAFAEAIMGNRVVAK
jgi:hypothetical protein